MRKRGKAGKRDARVEEVVTKYSLLHMTTFSGLINFLVRARACVATKTSVGVKWGGTKVKQRELVLVQLRFNLNR